MGKVRFELSHRLIIGELCLEGDQSFSLTIGSSQRHQDLSKLANLAQGVRFGVNFGFDRCLKTLHFLQLGGNRFAAVLLEQILFGLLSDLLVNRLSLVVQIRLVEGQARLHEFGEEVVVRICLGLAV